MVQQAEALRDAFSRRGFIEQAEAAERFRQEISELPDTPKDLDGVVLFDAQTQVGSDQQLEKVISHSGFTYALQLNTVVVNGKGTQLGIPEGKVLNLLLQNMGTIVTYKQFEVVWEGKQVNLPTVLRRHISTLRDALEPDKKEGEFQYLLNERGKGYKLVDPNKAMLSSNQDLDKQEAIMRTSEIAHIDNNNVSTPEGMIFRHYAFTFDLQTGRVVMKKDGEDVRLTDTERRLLGLLAQRHDVVVLHKEICMKIWGRNESDGNSYEKKAVERLRRKIEPEIKDRKKSKILRSVPGLGYVLNTEPYRIYSHSGFTYYLEDKRVVLANGKEYRLDKHKQENVILELLTESPGKIVREGVLEEALDDISTGEMYVDSPLTKYMFRLRKKLEPNGRRGNFRYIIYERGIGYKLVDPERSENSPVAVFEKLYA